MKFSIFNYQLSIKIVWILLSGIILLAGVLRFWQLGATPNGLDWDEVALGYNAYSILHTAKDEYGTFLPTVLKSFGDYKPALYAYLDIPAIAVLGLTTMSVRLPSAVFGVLTVLLTFFLVRELFKRDSIALVSAGLLSISPWHIQFSRVAFETNVGVFFNVLGVLLFLKALKRPVYFLPAAIVFALNLYVYQSEKVFTPLLVLLLVALFAKQLFKFPKKYLISACIVGLLVVAPVVYTTFFSANGLARAQGVSIFSSGTKISLGITDRYRFNKSTNDIVGIILDNSRLVYAKEIIGNYLSHFSINWLFITGDINRHHAPDMGLLYLWELPFILIGVYQVLFGKYSVKTKILLFGWFLLAPIPASITNDVPHAVRTMNFLPMYQIFTAIGSIEAFLYLKNKNYKKIPFGILLMGVGLLLIIFNFLYYLDQYFVQQNYFNALDWQYGYAQIVPETTMLGKSYKYIVVDSVDQFSQSYMFYLFYMQLSPAVYQEAGNQTPSAPHYFGKYVFRPIHWDSDKAAHDTLFVGNASDFPTDVTGLQKIIYTIDGKPLAAFVGR